MALFLHETVRTSSSDERQAGRTMPPCRSTRARPTRTASSLCRVQEHCDKGMRSFARKRAPGPLRGLERPSFARMHIRLCFRPPRYPAYQMKLMSLLHPVRDVLCLIFEHIVCA